MTQSRTNLNTSINAISPGVIVSEIRWEEFPTGANDLETTFLLIPVTLSGIFVRDLFACHSAFDRSHLLDSSVQLPDSGPDYHMVVLFRFIISSPRSISIHHSHPLESGCDRISDCW